MKTTITLSFLLIAGAFTASAQIIGPDNGSPQTFTTVQQEPSFVGGKKAMDSFILRSMQYPPEALQNKEEGYVSIKVIIQKDSTLKDPVVEYDGKLRYGLPEEALRIVKNMPKWIPGRMNGQPGSAYAYIRIRFNIEEYNKSR